MQGLAPDGKPMVIWRPSTAAEKIEEGIYKLRIIERLGQKTDRDMDALEEQVDAMEAAMQLEERLHRHSRDLDDICVVRSRSRAAGPLSESERRSLRQIRDIAVSAIADYESRVGPVPAYDHIASMFSDDIPLELPESLAAARELPSSSHRK